MCGFRLQARPKQIPAAMSFSRLAIRMPRAQSATTRMLSLVVVMPVWKGASARQNATKPTAEGSGKRSPDAPIMAQTVTTKAISSTQSQTSFAVGKRRHAIGANRTRLPGVGARRVRTVRAIGAPRSRHIAIKLSGSAKFLPCSHNREAA